MVNSLFSFSKLFYPQFLVFIFLLQIQILFLEMRKCPPIRSSIAPMASSNSQAFLEPKLCKKVNNIYKTEKNIYYDLRWFFLFFFFFVYLPSYWCFCLHHFARRIHTQPKIKQQQCVSWLYFRIIESSVIGSSTNPSTNTNKWRRKNSTDKNKMGRIKSIAHFIRLVHVKQEEKCDLCFLDDSTFSYCVCVYATLLRALMSNLLQKYSINHPTMNYFHPFWVDLKLPSAYWNLFVKQRFAFFLIRSNHFFLSLSTFYW